jgi:Domain of unknown function (DUF4397)
MAYKNMRNIWVWFCLGMVGVLFVSSIQSCGKSTAASAAGLNIEYEILNLSPNLGAISLYANFLQVNPLTSGYTYGINSDYFYVPSIAIPYQFRPFLYNENTGTTLFSRSDSLKAGLKYSLFITGTAVNGVPQQLFTVDTASEPSIGRAKIRFVNVSPSATSGLDLYANGTLAFGAQPYPTSSKFIEVPVGNYDIQIKGAGNSAILNEQPIVTVQDGRLYTIYAYGYTTRSDSAAFNAGVITNK